MKTYAYIQAGILALGTLFAWVNFSIELTAWPRKGEMVGCTGNAIADPFMSACFYGAIFFTVAFLLNVGMLRKLPK